MIILGIDPGTATTGWGVIKAQKTGDIKHSPVERVREAAEIKQSSSMVSEGYALSLVGFGCITTSSEDEMGERLLVISRALRKIIRSYQPDCIVIEQLFFGANSTSALSVGQARGVILLAARENRLPTFEYTGLAVKLAVANHGRAEKKAIQTAVRRHLRTKNLPKPKNQIGEQVFRFRDDAYDAVAAAICHVIKSANREEQTEKS